MKKKFVIIISFTTMTVFSFYQENISFDLFVIGVKVISMTGTILSVLDLLWNKLLWKIPAKMQWEIYKRPFIIGRYNVAIEWSKNGKKNIVQKTTAKVLIKQDSDNSTIYLISESATSCSGKIDIRCFPNRYELYYHYYMMPKDSSMMKTNPAHDGAAKIIIENNRITKWEYWTTRDTKGTIFITQ